MQKPPRSGTFWWYIFGQNGQNAKVFGPIIKPARLGKDGESVQLQHNDQEDIRKALFYGQIAVSIYQSTGMGVVSVGKGQETERVDMGSG